jgi:hypothetical protein
VQRWIAAADPYGNGMMPPIATATPSPPNSRAIDSPASSAGDGPSCRDDSVMRER